MKILIAKLAQNEINEAKDYYNLQQQNLGNNFVLDIQKVVDTIIKFPDLYPIISQNIRKVVIHRFPYCVYYSIIDNTIIILSVAHQHRKPIYQP